MFFLLCFVGLGHACDWKEVRFGVGDRGSFCIRFPIYRVYMMKKELTDMRRSNIKGKQRAEQAEDKASADIAVLLLKPQCHGF